MGAWLADTLGSTTCFSLHGQAEPTTKGSILSERYCDIQRVQEAFSWLLFVLMLIWFFLIFNLAHRSVAMGREFIWREDVNFLPWFGQAPSWPGLDEGQYPEQYRPFYGYPGFTQTPGAYPGYVQQQPSYVHQPGYVQSQPGYATVINGSHVSQVPTAYATSQY